MTNEEIRQRLLTMQDIKYRDFSIPLIPGAENVIGVRVPEIDKLAREIAKTDWRKYLSEAANDYMEEIMLQGMVIAHAKANTEEIFPLIANFIPKINNWAICDCFCNRLKITIKNKEKMWDFLQVYLHSEKEYEIRFGLVMLLSYFISKDYITRVLQAIDQAKANGYYVKMAAAWVLSVAYVKFPKETMSYLKQNNLDDFTYNKALQKICESFRVCQEDKAVIRRMKRN